MTGFPKDPIQFAVSFVRKLRTHKDVKNIPSVRQSISIVKLIMAKFERNMEIFLDDYITAAVITTPIEDQKIAHEIAWALLYQQEMIENFDAMKLLEETEILSDLFGKDDSKTKENFDEFFDELNNLREEIQYIEEISKIKSDYQEKFNDDNKFNDFFHDLELKREQQPYKDYIDYLGGLDNIAKMLIGSEEELKDIIKNDLLSKCNQGQTGQDQMWQSQMSQSQSQMSQSQSQMSQSQSQMSQSQSQGQISQGQGQGQISQGQGQCQSSRSQISQGQCRSGQSQMGQGQGQISQGQGQCQSSRSQISQGQGQMGQGQGQMGQGQGQMGQGQGQMGQGQGQSFQQMLNLAEQLGITNEMYQNTDLGFEKFMYGMKSNMHLDQLMKETANNNLNDFISQVRSAHLENMMDRNTLDEVEQFISKKFSESDGMSLKDYKNAAMSLGKKLDSLSNDTKSNLIDNSIKSMNYNELMDTANFLDVNYGTDFNSELIQTFEQYADMLQQLNFDELASNPNLSSAWRDAFQNSILRELEQLNSMNPSNADFQFFDMLQKLQSTINNTSDIHLSDFLQQNQFDLNNQYMQSMKDPVQFLKNLQMLKDLNSSFDTQQMMSHGQSLKVPNDKLMEILNPGYEFIKSMIQNGVDDMQRYLNALKNSKLSSSQIESLAKTAVESQIPNKSALSAFGSVDLGSVLPVLKHNMGKDDIRDVLYGMGAGNGEGLISQWFMHRDHMKGEIREILKEYIKNLMFELGGKYANMYLGSAEAGPVTQNRVRTYEDGDDVDLIDMEETLQGLLESGKSIRWIENDDFLVSVTEKGLRTVCMQLDISGSMGGKKLAYMAISTAMMIMKLDPQELAIAMFESNLHVLKNLDERVENDLLAEQILEIKATGGTVIKNAIKWASESFKKHSKSKIKVNIMFTDAAIYDIKGCSEIFNEMVSDGVQFIFVVPKMDYSGKLAQKMKEWTNGTIISIEDWKDFPEKISKLIN